MGGFRLLRPRITCLWRVNSAIDMTRSVRSGKPIPSPAPNPTFFLAELQLSAVTLSVVVVGLADREDRVDDAVDCVSVADCEVSTYPSENALPLKTAPSLGR